MLRWTRKALTAMAASGFEVVSAGDVAAQKTSLQRLLREHNEGVARNTNGTITVPSTYDTTAALFFDRYNLVVLPSVGGGAARQPVRTRLRESGAVDGVQRLIVAPWLAEGHRRVVVFGCRSVRYLQRHLRTDTSHAFLVVDASLRDLTEAATALVPEFGARVSFLRCESMFACLAVLPPAAVDLALVPMPVPFWSRQGSHRRLVHFDFFCAVHRTLRERDGAADPRGIVLFTDCEPYAAFMMEHLEEAKLVVPYTRKNPHDLFRRWLPQDRNVNVEGKGERLQREFPMQRESEVVAIAAAKSGPTTAEAERLLASYTYARKYYRDFTTDTAAS